MEHRECPIKGVVFDMDGLLLGLIDVAENTVNRIFFPKEKRELVDSNSRFWYNKMVD